MGPVTLRFYIVTVIEHPTGLSLNVKCAVMSLRSEGVNYKDAVLSRVYNREKRAWDRSIKNYLPR